MNHVAKQLASGYTCECGKFNKYHSYVYGHWDIILVHTCECGRKYRILGGIAAQILPDWEEAFDDERGE